jgi:hypothetical protein
MLGGGTMKKVLGFVLIALIAIPMGAQAQVRLGLSGGVSGYTGDDFDGVESGFTFGGELVFPLMSGLEVGGAFDYSAFGVEDVDEDLSQIDIFGVVRYPIVSESVHFLIGGKAGYSREKLTIIEDITRNGWGIGPTAGIRIPLTSLSIDIVADGIYQSFGDFSSDGETAEDSDGSGFRWTVRGGISIPLGG